MNNAKDSSFRVRLIVWSSTLEIRNVYKLNEITNYEWIWCCVVLCRMKRKKKSLSSFNCWFQSVSTFFSRMDNNCCSPDFHDLLPLYGWISNVHSIRTHCKWYVHFSAFSRCNWRKWTTEKSKNHQNGCDAEIVKVKSIEKCQKSCGRVNTKTTLSSIGFSTFKMSLRQNIWHEKVLKRMKRYEKEMLNWLIFALIRSN